MICIETRFTKTSAETRKDDHSRHRMLCKEAAKNSLPCLKADNEGSRTPLQLRDNLCMYTCTLKHSMKYARLLSMNALALNCYAVNDYPSFLCCRTDYLL